MAKKENRNKNNMIYIAAGVAVLVIIILRKFLNKNLITLSPSSSPSLAATYPPTQNSGVRKLKVSKSFASFNKLDDKLLKEHYPDDVTRTKTWANCDLFNADCDSMCNSNGGGVTDNQCWGRTGKQYTSCSCVDKTYPVNPGFNKNIGVQQATPYDCASMPEWLPSTIYYTGDYVTFQGKYYVAKWWNQNNDPINNSGQWDAWKLFNCQ